MVVSNWAQEIFDLDITLTRIELWSAELRRDLAFRRAPYLSALKYDPNQPRVPAGYPDGGQWTSVGSGQGGVGSLGDWFSESPREGSLRELTEEPEGETEEELGDEADEGLGVWRLDENDPDKPLIHEASNRSRSSGGNWPNASPAQQARLTASELQAQAAIRRVQEIEVNWRPGPSISQGIEGAIATNQAIVRQAEGRLRELQGMGLGFGPFAREWIPARGAGRTNAEEQRDVNRMGYTFGCHTCGTTTPGTRSGNYIGDHQVPSALARPGQRQWLLPHCASCSLSQGGFITGLKWGRK